MELVVAAALLCVSRMAGVRARVLVMRGKAASVRAYAGCGVQASQLGRVIQFDPATGKSKVLGSKLWFASGVALSQNEDFLLISEAFGAPMTHSLPPT